MLGYAINKKAGGVTYNIFHHKGVAIAVTITGFLLRNDTLMLAGTLLSSSLMLLSTGYGDMV